jgi:biopolymer transport protein TolR
MAFQTDKKRYTGALCDINVTPLVDVVLVLLIIFMIAAPVIMQSLNTQLPKTTISDANVKSEQVVVTIDSLGEISVNQSSVRAEDLVKALQIVLVEREKYVYLRADKDLPYGEVVKVIELIKQAGIHDIGMVTELEEERE